MLSMELNGFMNKGFMNIATNLSVALETPFLFFDENNQLLWQIGFQEDIEKALQWSNMSCMKDQPINSLSEQNSVNGAENLMNNTT